ncbi:MAG TPA: hypothetical protein VNA22_02140 [Pyrinomonadaceae bacterium]|nr:hypothetical protein [Pyrinomonadaceae bacterium]
MAILNILGAGSFIEPEKQNVSSLDRVTTRRNEFRSEITRVPEDGMAEKPSVKVP